MSRTILVAPFENITACKAMVAYDAIAPSAATQTTRSLAVVDPVRGVAVTATATEAARKTMVVDRYSEAPRGLLEDLLAKQSGIALVERQRVDALLMEQQFSGFTNPQDAMVLGRMAGARYLITGTIQDIAARAATFTGYGVAVRRTTVTAQVRVRMIDVETGRIIASTNATGEESFGTDQFGGTADADVAYRVIARAVAAIGKDGDFLQKVMGQSGDGLQRIAVVVEPVPNGCDILVDGAFVGSSPQTVSLVPGRLIRLTLQHPACQSWERTLTPGSAMRIAPVLLPAVTPAAAGAP